MVVVVVEVKVIFYLSKLFFMHQLLRVYREIYWNEKKKAIKYCFNMCMLSSFPTVEGEPVPHRESGPVNCSGTTGLSGAGAEAQGGRVQGRSHQAADGKTCAAYEPQ
ncbi:MAG: hypothetical protein ATN36_02155 [Epulopiscium sp. Nele67-Bin005]|nr:MAG: hypothetical protein ATN36_02155 [Epulopiscium sp. Nele67-Bin005]